MEGMKVGGRQLQLVFSCLAGSAPPRPPSLRRPAHRLSPRRYTRTSPSSRWQVFGWIPASVSGVCRPSWGLKKKKGVDVSWKHSAESFAWPLQHSVGNLTLQPSQGVTAAERPCRMLCDGRTYRASVPVPLDLEQPAPARRRIMPRIPVQRQGSPARVLSKPCAPFPTQFLSLHTSTLADHSVPR
jgi:hypothetical protein